MTPLGHIRCDHSLVLCWCGGFWSAFLVWLFLPLVAGVAVSLSHLLVGCLWPVLLALLFLVLVLRGLLLAVAASVAVLVLDPGVSDSWAR